MLYTYEFGATLREEVLLETTEDHIVAMRGLRKFQESTRCEDAQDNLEMLIGEVRVSMGRVQRGYPPSPFWDQEGRVVTSAVEDIAASAGDALQAVAAYILQEAGSFVPTVAA